MKKNNINYQNIFPQIPNDQKNDGKNEHVNGRFGLFYDLKNISSQNLYSDIFGLNNFYSNKSLNYFQSLSKSESEFFRSNNGLKIADDNNSIINSNLNNNNMNINEGIRFNDSLRLSQIPPSNQFPFQENKPLNYCDYFLRASSNIPNIDYDLLNQNKININIINNNKNYIINTNENRSINNKSNNMNNNLNINMNGNFGNNFEINNNNIIINNNNYSNNNLDINKSNIIIHNNNLISQLEEQSKQIIINKNNINRNNEEEQLIKNYTSNNKINNEFENKDNKNKNRIKIIKKNNETNVYSKIIKYGHPKARIYKTMKQKLNIHKKLDRECRDDSISLIHGISELRKIIKVLTNNTNSENKTSIKQLKDLYKTTILGLQHKEYAQNISGYKLI